MKLHWTRQAQQELLEIGRYISKDNRAAARRWVERLRQRAQQAAEHPYSGRIVPEHSRPELREILVRNYRIVYLVGEDAIAVLSVFEGHRLLPNDMGPDALDDRS